MQASHDEDMTTLFDLHCTGVTLVYHMQQDLYNDIEIGCKTPQKSYEAGLLNLPYYNVGSKTTLIRLGSAPPQNADSHASNGKMSLISGWVRT